MCASFSRGNLAQMRHLVKAWFLVCLFAAPAKGALQNLPLSKLREFQKEPCVLIHPWATWCTVCVQEMPTLLPQFETWKGVRVVVVDISNPFSQDQFSRKWKVLGQSKMPTYLLPGREDPKIYQAAIDPDWDGTLPHTVLYVKGKKSKVWNGALDFVSLQKEVAGLCR